MIIAQARVDDRLIHGQVVTQWSKTTKIERIIVVSDNVAGDFIRSTLLKQVAPPGISVSVVEIEKFIRVYNNPKYEKDRVMLLFDTPIDAERIIDKGVEINRLNVGGLSYKEGRKELTKCIYADKAEAECLLRIADQGIYLDTRAVPKDKEEDLVALIKEQNFEE